MSKEEPTNLAQVNVDGNMVLVYDFE